MKTTLNLDDQVLKHAKEEAARSGRADFTDVTARLREAGAIVTSQITQTVMRAAQEYRILNATGAVLMAIAVVLIALLGAAWGWRGYWSPAARFGCWTNPPSRLIPARWGCLPTRCARIWGRGDRR